MKLTEIPAITRELWSLTQPVRRFSSSTESLLDAIRTTAQKVVYVVASTHEEFEDWRVSRQLRPDYCTFVSELRDLNRLRTGGIVIVTGAWTDHHDYIAIDTELYHKRAVVYDDPVVYK